MNIMPVNLTAQRPDVLRIKHVYGIWYGVIVGLAFAVFCLGVDGYVLSNYHGMQPWLKFTLGAVLCMTCGGFIGWVSARLNNALYSLILWFANTSIFAWLTINLPLMLLPNVLPIVEPQTSGLLHYTYYEEFGSRYAVAFIWLAIFIALIGLLQIPLSDSAVFSTSFFGKLSPIFVSIILMGICGTIADNLVNEPLRSSIAATDETIQFVIDNRGKEVNREEFRRMHAGAFRAIEDIVTPQRELIVSGYDSMLGEIDVLIHFEQEWVECKVLYNQPSLCKVIEISLK